MPPLNRSEPVRDDLLDAEACIDWAEAQFSILAARIEAWQESSPYDVVAEFDPQRGMNALKFDVRHPLPRIVSAETGAIIHMIRSSLDLLAVTLARRNGHLCPRDVCFPITKSEKGFFAQNGGLKKIKRLSPKNIDIVKTLRPYHGGNDSLYAVHFFDIERKHRQLLRIRPATEHWGLWGIGINAEFPEPPVFDVEHGAVLAWISADAPHHDVSFPCEVALGQPHVFPVRPILTALGEFASLATSIIKLFDD